MATRSKRGPMRYPLHVGTREWAGSEIDGKCLAAIPLFKGETLRKLRLDCMATTRTAETNFDQPPIFVWVGLIVPFPLGQVNGTSITTAVLDTFVDDFDAIDDAHLGGDDAVGASTNWFGSEGAGLVRVIFRRQRIGVPVPVSLDGLGNADARFIDKFESVIDTDYKVNQHSIVIFGAKTYEMDAQTTFGVTSLDNSETPVNFPGIYAGKWLTEGGTATIAKEVIHGGDNYIEADSFKETSRRHYVIAGASIEMNRALMEPGFRG